MKIIFDSEEQKDRYFAIFCPDEEFGLKQDENCCNAYGKKECINCWKQSGLEYEIKEEVNNENYI